MSNQRLTIGLIALLQNPIDNLHTDEWENVSETLYNLGSKLRITYGGDMVVYRHIDVEAYGAPLQIFGANNPMLKPFGDELAKAGRDIIPGSVKIFVDSWYDGADAPHIDLTREEAGYGSKDAVPVR